MQTDPRQQSRRVPLTVGYGRSSNSNAARGAKRITYASQRNQH